MFRLKLFALSFSIELFSFLQMIFGISDMFLFQISDNLIVTSYDSDL